MIWSTNPMWSLPRANSTFNPLRNMHHASDSVPKIRRESSVKSNMIHRLIRSLDSPHQLLMVFRCHIEGYLWVKRNCFSTQCAYVSEYTDGRQRNLCFLSHPSYVRTVLITGVLPWIFYVDGYTCWRAVWITVFVSLVFLQVSSWRPSWMIACFISK